MSDYRSNSSEKETLYPNLDEIDKMNMELQNVRKKDEQIPIIDGKQELTLEMCNEYTQYLPDDKLNRTIYVYDYDNLPVKMDRYTLKDLKEKNQWDVVKHPLVLNYINEILVECAWTYLGHIVLYFTFLFMLYSYIHADPQTWNNTIVTIIVFFLLFFLLVKAKLKTERDSCDKISIWFCTSYVITFFTYVVTLFFIWSPILFNFDNYNMEIKRTISWFLPIIAIIASWIQCLYVLRKSPCGPYVLMMCKILKSFMGTIFIWVPTLLCFAFSFQLVMRDSGKEPWNDVILSNHSSIFMTMFQSFTKTSAMMIGEVEANDILELRAWIANLLLIMFEIITVILLMNLMISLAVGDVSDLRKYSHDALLKIKLNFCIESLHLSEMLPVISTPLFKKKINNVAVVYKLEDQMFTLSKDIKSRLNFPVKIPEREQVHDLTLNAESVRFIASNIAPGSTLDRIRVLGVNNAVIRVTELRGSGLTQINNEGFIKELEGLKDNESSIQKFKRWLIGLNWNHLLN